MSERKQNMSKYYYQKYSKLAYALGAPNFWYEDLAIPKFIQYIHDSITTLMDIILWIYYASETASYFTQNDLNDEQKFNRAIYSVIHPLLYSFVHIIAYHNDKVKDVAYNLTVKLKSFYNDLEVEKQMVKLAKIYSLMFSFFVTSALVFYGADVAARVYTKDANFVTIITAWPDVKDDSKAAGVVRVIAYVLWWVYAIRVLSAAYIVVILITVGLSHQYKNLCSYFYSLNNIFEDNSLLEEEKEKKYVDAFKTGIEVHLKTLRCTRQTQKICSAVFSIQIIVNIGTLIMLMLQLVNLERTLANTLPIVFTLCCVLISTGCFFWNAGDVTVAASKLPTAMFNSGWHNCQQKTLRRISPMLLVSIWQSQRPVELRCLGVVKLSYESYVTIVKSSYSVFSVLY